MGGCGSTEDDMIYEPRRRGYYRSRSPPVMYYGSSRPMPMMYQQYPTMGPTMMRYNGGYPGMPPPYIDGPVKSGGIAGYDDFYRGGRYAY